MTETEFKSRYIKARKAVIARDFSHLNDMQQQAVLATEGPLLLLAGAGSGKTTVLINRIANLLRYGKASDSELLPEDANEEKLAILESAAADKSFPDMEKARRLAAFEPCEPWRVIAITFTNKAANELKIRLERMLGEDARDVWAQTFHSACVRILRAYSERLGYDSSFTIYDTSDSQSVMKHILKDMELDEKQFPYKTVLNYISKAKDAMQTPEQFVLQAKAIGDIRQQRIGEAYEAYAKRLKNANAMDYDDLIYNTVKLFDENPDVLKLYQKRFKYVLIDEYQDTNNLQYRLASALAGGSRNICVVGDDDQSIYKFRGATIENILSFESQYKEARVIRLEQNYRSTANILNAANAVIKNNQARKGKELWTENCTGDKLTLYVAQNEEDEAQYVTTRILEGFTQGINFRENAVLYRMNAQSNKLEYAFKRSGVPYRIIGGTRFFDRAEIKDMMAYLTVILMPQDNLRLTRIINSPPRGIGDRTVEISLEIAAENQLSMFEVIKDADRYPELSRASGRLREFTSMIEDFRKLAEDTPSDELFDIVVEKTGYVRELEAKISDENRARVENIRELKTNIISYTKDTGDSGLAGFLDEVALYTDLDSYDADSDCVTMMTMHSAKGLEFDNVFIVGAEEGIFPSVRSIGEPEDMEEERRLCYVGITRAKKRLTLSCARQRMIFGLTSANNPSRFIEEIPENYLERIESERNDSFGIRPELRTHRAAYSKPTAQRTLKQMIAPKQEQKPSAEFRTGDRVRHSAFGEGVITKMSPMGGDYFIEIEFAAGSKRLMLRAAAEHMTKLLQKGILMAENKKNAVLGRLALLVTTLIWGTSFVLLKNTLETVPTFYVLAYRFSGAAVLMLLIGFRDIKKIDKSYIISGAVMGTALFAAYSLQTYGLYFSTPAKNAFLTTTYCVIVPFIYWVYEKKRPDAYSISAAFICLLGMGFVSLENDFSVNIGDALTVCCGIFYAFHIVLTGKFVKGRSIAMLTMFQFATAGVLSWILALLTAPIPSGMSAGNAWSIVYLCVMCTAVCFVFQTYGQKYTPPSTAAIIMTLESVFGAIFSVWLYHETLSFKLVAGFVLILASVLICETKLDFLRRKTVSTQE